MAEDSDKEVRITYETLYEILRREKSNDELQKLDESFFIDFINYLREKNKILQDAAGKFDIFSVTERENMQIQLNNIKRILKELYERREKKIIDMALNKSRTHSNIIDTTNLLELEKPIYQELVKLLDSFRKEILLAMLELKTPEMLCKIMQEKAQAAETKSEIKDAAETLNNLQCQPQTAQQQESKKKIKFTQKVEQFVGPELDVYGPFEPEQIVELSSEIADILLEKGSAVEVR
ncbi:MAG: hypothetical protein QW666_02975 [Candidatus Woesearchaeota archaeon]